MRFLCFVTPLLSGAVFICVTMNLAFAQNFDTSMRDLLAHADSTSPVLAAARADLAVARSEYASNRGWPNPLLFGEQESLSGAEEIIETSYGVEQNLGFLWTQSARVSSAKYAYGAKLVEYEEFHRTWSVETAELLLELDALRQRRDLLDSVVAAANELAGMMTARYSEGDVSAYDEQRVVLETIELRSQRQVVDREYQIVLRELIRQTGLPTEQLEAIKVLQLVPAPLATETEAIGYALEHRSLLKQSELQRTSAAKAASAAKMNQLPDLNFGVGRKEINNGSDGWILQAELELPLFHQRRGQKQLASAQLRRMEIQQSADRRLVDAEVKQAFEFRERMKTNAAKDNDWSVRAKQNMERGIQRFLEGEDDAIEVIDALRTSIEAQESALSLRNSAILAELELRRVTGYNLWD